MAQVDWEKKPNCETCKYCDKAEKICYYMGDTRCVYDKQADGEYISREEAIKKFNTYIMLTREAYACSVSVDEMERVIFEILKQMPSVAIPPEHDGCKDCKHENKSDGEYPCSYCKQNYRDMWEMKNPTDTITMTREEFNKVIMEHYRQGRSDEKAYQNGEIMQSFNPD